MFPAPAWWKQQLPIIQAPTCIIENKSSPLHHPATLVSLAATRWKLQLPMFKHPLEPLRTPILPSSSQPPWFLWLQPDGSYNSLRSRTHLNLWGQQSSRAPPNLPMIQIFATETYYSDKMFNNGLPDSSLFCCILLLCLLHCLPAHMTCIICSSSFYALCTMSIHYTIPLLFNSASALSSLFTHESPSTTTTTTTPTVTTTASLI